MSAENIKEKKYNVTYSFVEIPKTKERYTKGEIIAGKLTANILSQLETLKDTDRVTIGYVAVGIVRKKLD